MNGYGKSDGADEKEEGLAWVSHNWSQVKESNNPNNNNNPFSLYYIFGYVFSFVFIMGYINGVGKEGD